MATKVKLMKLLQEIRGFAQLSQRRAQSKPPVGLFLLQMRSQINRSAPKRRRLTIPIQMFEGPDIPNDVKITHIPTTPSAPITPL